MSERKALRRRAWRTLAVAGGTWIAAAVTTAAPAVWMVAAGLGLAAAVVGAVFVRFRYPALLVATVALACAAAAGGTVATLAPTRQAVAALEVDGGRHLRVTATVTGHVSGSADGGAWFDATVTSVSAGRTTVRGVIPARIGVDAEGRERLSAAGQGSEMVVSGRAIPSDPPSGRSSCSAPSTWSTRLHREGCGRRSRICATGSAPRPAVCRNPEPASCPAWPWATRRASTPRRRRR